VRHDDDGNATVIFGDGRQGARLPTGTANVIARYRSGIGLDGMVGAGRLTVLQTKPLGIRDATNPVAASGADDAETLADARDAAPVTVRTLGRVVSLDDYADFARTFAGVGKATASALWTGHERIVAVTIGSAAGQPVPESDVLRRNLAVAIAAARAPLEPFRVVTFQPLFFSMAAHITVDASLLPERVIEAVRAALLDAFGFARRRFGQDVTAAEVVTVIHSVAGVQAVNLTALHLVTEGASGSTTLSSRLSAEPARWSEGSLVQADLLRINPAGIQLTVVQS
jgi:predicted phage baseplate assembly protein